jgi:PAS domain S-box-containing protein
MSDPDAVEVRRLNRLYYASSRVSQALVQAVSIETVVPEICRRLASDGSFLLAWIGRLDTSAGSLIPMGWGGTEDAERVKLLAEGQLARQALAENTSVVWNDLATGNLAQCGAGFGAAAAFSLRPEAGPDRVLCLYHPEIGFFGVREISVLTDIAESIATGLDKVERDLRQKADLSAERSFLRALMDNPCNLIYFKDVNSRFIRCSRGLCERFGVRPDQIVGLTDFDIFREEHAREAFDDEQRIIRTGEPVTGKIEKETWKNGQDSWCITAKSPLRDDDGKIIGTVGISKDFTPVKEAEAKLEEMHGQLLEASRGAGMAEVATSILHNVGNVLNSVNVSCSVVSDKIRKSRVANVARLAELLNENTSDLSGFLAGPKGRQFPVYLTELSSHLASERDEMLRELQSLTTNIEHIKEIVASQQSYARTAGVIESIALPGLVDDALAMHRGAFGRHGVRVIREYSETPPILVDKHKVLQILINLLHNSKYAVDEGGAKDKWIKVRLEKHLPEAVRISIIDNGVGILPENLRRIFEHGFTTRRNGHGFGLHSGALTAKELGGSLTASSEGAGRGARFDLQLPFEPPKEGL